MVIAFPIVISRPMFGRLAGNRLEELDDIFELLSLAGFLPTGIAHDKWESRQIAAMLNQKFHEVIGPFLVEQVDVRC